DDSKEATLVLTANALDLLVNKVDSGFEGAVDPLGYDPTQPGTNLVTYRIRAQNLGPSIATGATILDTITPPAGKTVEFVGSSATATGTFAMGGCAVTAGSNPTTGAAMTLECVMPPVPASAPDGTIIAGAQSDIYLRFRYDT